MRLFLALELPAEVRSTVAAAVEALPLDRRDWRRTRAEALHLTLRFLGEVDERTRAAVEPAARAAAAGVPPLPLRVGGFGGFPEKGRPRVAWVGIEDLSQGGALARLGEALEQAARESGLPPEPRPFRPHVTVARAREGARPAPVPAGAPGPLALFVATQVTLFRSDLKPGGPTYTAVGAYPLSGRAPA